MSNIHDWLHIVEHSPDETPTSDTRATPSMVADATSRPPSPQISALFDGMSISFSLPTRHTHRPVAGPSVPVPLPFVQLPDEDGEVIDLDSSEEGVTHTTYGAVSFGGNRSRVTLRLMRNGVDIPPLIDEDEDEAAKVEEQTSVVDLEQDIDRSEKILDELMRMYDRAQSRASRSRRHMIDESDVPEDSCPGVRRTRWKGHKLNPYSLPADRKAKRGKRMLMELPPVAPECGEQEQQYDDRPYYCPPNHIDDYPYRPPTPYPSTMEMPDDEGLVATRPNTPPHIDGGMLGLSNVSVIRQLTLEKIDIADDDDGASVEAQADVHDVAPVITSALLDEAHALLTRTFAELESANSPIHAAPTHLTPGGTNPGLCTDSHRELTPVESPLPKTPISPPDGFDGEVVDRSPKLPGCKEIFGASDNRDDYDTLPNPRRNSEKTVTTENADTTASQQPATLPTQALAPTESVVVSDIPAQSISSPACTVAMVAPQREMSWTTLPVSSAPATIQPPPAQLPSVFTQPCFAWGQPVQYQAPPAAPWPQAPLPAPLSTSTWMAPPQSVSALYHPIAIPQLPTTVHHIAPPQAEMDMSMDIDPFVDVAASRSGRQCHRSRRDHRRAARQLLRVAAVEPGLDVRKRTTRRVFQHLFAIRQRPVEVCAFQSDRAVRKGLVVQRSNRRALRRARRSVRPTLRCIGRAARPVRGAPQSIQRTMSVEMAVEDSSAYCADVDVDMDSGDLSAMPATESIIETVTSDTVFPPSSIPPIPCEPAIPVELSIPVIIITPNTPLPRHQSQERLCAADPAPTFAVSLVPQPTMMFDSEKHALTSPPRQESALAEFEVPLVEAAPPAATNNPEPVVATEAVVETQHWVDNAEGETDDETEWEPIPVPPVPANAPSTVEESTPPAKSVSAEQEAPADADVPVEVPAPNVAEDGPEIIFHSYEPKDVDTVSLGYSEDEREHQFIYGEDGEDYGDDDEDGDYEDDDSAEEETETEEEDKEEDEEDENNEYDESAPINGPVARPRTSAPTSAPTSVPFSSLPASSPAPVKASAPLPTPSTLPPSDLTGGPYIGSVTERYDESATYRKSVELLTNAANVSSGTRLSGVAAQEARAQARLRNHANQVQQRNAAQDIIRSIAAKPMPEPMPEVASSTISSHVPFEATTPHISSEAAVIVDKNAPESHHDCAPVEQAWNDWLMPNEEHAEIVSSRPDKGKGKATDWDALLAAPALVVDPSFTEVIDGLDLSPTEVRINLNAFPRADSKVEAARPSQCGCSLLANGPSSGHTLACQNARGVRRTPLVVSKPSSDLGFGSSIGASPTSAPSLLATHQDSHFSALEVSLEAEQSPSVLKTEIDQGEWQPTQASIDLPTTPLLVAHEVHEQQPLSPTDFVKDDIDPQLTGVSKAWADALAIPTTFSTTEQDQCSLDANDPWLSAPDYTAQPSHAFTPPSTTIDPSALDLSAEVHKILDAIISGTFTHDDAVMDQEIQFSLAEVAPSAGLDFSALASGLSADPALDEQLLDLFFSLPDPTNDATIDGTIVNESVPQHVASAPLVSTNGDGCTPAIFSQGYECDDVVWRAEDSEEMHEVDAEIVSCPLAIPSNDEEQDRSSEACAFSSALLEERPQLESDIPVLAAVSLQAHTGAEPSLGGDAFLQPHPPSELSLPLGWVPPPLVDPSAPLPPARVPTPPPCVPQDATTLPVAEEHTEQLDHVEGTSPASEPEAKDGSPAPELPAPSSPLVRRRSGGPRDRIACPHEKRTYYGPRPSSEQWRAFLASPPSVSRLPSWSVKSKSLSVSPSPVVRSYVKPCGSSRLRTTPTSTSSVTSTVTEPTYSRLPSRGRPRHRAAMSTGIDQSNSTKDVATQTTKREATTAVKKRESKGNRKCKEQQAYAPPSSTSSDSYPPSLAPPDSPSPPEALSLPSWVKPPCCPNFSRTGREPCIHVLRASGQLAGTRWESESSDSELEEEKDVSSAQGWSTSYLAKLSLAAGACYLFENVVF